LQSRTLVQRRLWDGRGSGPASHDLARSESAARPCGASTSRWRGRRARKRRRGGHLLIPPSRHPRTLAGRRNGTTGLSRFGLWPSTIQIETLLLIDLLSVNTEMSDRPPFILEGGGLIPIWMTTFGFAPRQFLQRLRLCPLLGAIRTLLGPSFSESDPRRTPIRQGFLPRTQFRRS